MKYLAVLLSSTILVACGGGGGGDGTGSLGAAASSSLGVSLANAALAKYEGVWRQDCFTPNADLNQHMRLTRTATATSGTTFSVATKEEFFDNVACAGTPVATGVYALPDETVTYAATVPGASVTLESGAIVVADVDPANSVLAIARYILTGSGASSQYALGTTVARIDYPNGTHSVIFRNDLNGQTSQGALALLNGELLALLPIGGSSASFQVNRRYIR